MTPRRFTPVQQTSAVALGLVFPTFVLKMLVVPLTTRDPAAKVDFAAAHAGLLQLNVALELLVALLLLTGLVAPLSLVRARGVGLVRAGCVFALLGSMSFAHDAAYSLFLLATRGGDASQMTQLVRRLDAVAAPLELPLLICFAISLLLLAGGSRRAGLLPSWAFWGVVIAFALQVAQPFPGAGLLLNVIAGVSFAALCLGMLRTLRTAAVAPRVATEQAAVA